MRKFNSLFIFSLAISFFPASSIAKIGELLIDGEISQRNYGNTYILTESEFNSLKKSHIKTTTSWTATGRAVDFEGVKFKDLLSRVGARGKTLRVHALNDYWVDIPLSDVEQFDILLANKMDGKPLKLRDFGPYFVIYPIDRYYDKLNSPTYQARHIWQVNRITVLDK
ncbi:molybdopterin-dependent oxidoreductase [Serratia ureilytica]|uniref:molybdopterin-dependent oxidoreductase n=1 Tax=Serratia ureilytica TaxID=300181 RepID=UPI0039B5DED7